MGKDTANPMRILVVSHTYTVDLNCNKLRQLAALAPEVSVTVAVPKWWAPGGVQWGRVVSQPSHEGAFQVVPIANWSQQHQGLLGFGWEAITLLRRFRPHLIQVEQGTKAIAYAQFITLNRLLGLGAKNVVFTWWNVPYSLRGPAAWLEAYNLRHTHGAIAGNQDGANILRDRGYGGPLTVLPQLGVDEQHFAPQPQPTLAAQLNIGPQEFVVGFVGRFVEEKGLLTLARSLAELQHLPWKWLLVGRGSLKSAVMEQAIAHGFADRLIWVENVPHADIPRYLNLMSVLVLPSQTSDRFKTLTSVGWKEQFGHVLIEAMACGVPVIGSSSGEIPHVIGSAGLVFAEGNVAELRDRLLQLMQSPTWANTLGTQGRDRVLQHYTNRVLAQQQFAFYQQLLSQEHPPTH
ncbi:hormogonium polysaccharide biosynthesis glycosyltransferase HpsO [Leptolyngbya sp. AN02str]|uniref:hormogonium polysaccharide biosynthesis glycosyltransferase HpsO n=1 Tax=Leptolyngbya sp. AN02str TaxID=3423363 RepID=UPI003D323C70